MEGGKHSSCCKKCSGMNIGVEFYTINKKFGKGFAIISLLHAFLYID